MSSFSVRSGSRPPADSNPQQWAASLDAEALRLSEHTKLLKHLQKHVCTQMCAEIV